MEQGRDSQSNFRIGSKSNAINRHALHPFAWYGGCLILPRLRRDVFSMAIHQAPTQEASAGVEQVSRVRVRALDSTQILLSLAIGLAVFLRIGSALYQGNTVADLPGIYDQMSYHELAIRVADGHGFSFGEGHWPATPADEPTAHWSYLYTLYLSGIYRLVGVEPLLARLLQALIAGVLHTWLAYRIGHRVFSRTTGLLAAFFSAIYLYFVYYAGGLLTETFYFVGILWTLDAALRIASTEAGQARRWQWLELGLAIGLTVLLRQVFVLFVPLLFLWLWWNVPAQRSASSWSATARARLSILPGLLVAGFVVAALIAPFTVRNYRAFGTFVPLNTNAGFAFFWGNHPIHGASFIPLLGEETYQSLIPVELRTLNEAELDRALLEEALGFIREDPRRFALLSLDRSREYFRFWPTADSSRVSNLARVGSFALFLPLMLYGLWLSLRLVRQPRHDGQGGQIVLLYLFMLTYTSIHLMTWTLIRYRLPVDAVLIIFAALACARIAASVQPFQAPSTAKGAA